MTIKDIGDYIKAEYPKATSVILTFGYHQTELTVKTVSPTTGNFTFRTLDGTWLEVKKEAQSE